MGADFDTDEHNCHLPTPISRVNLWTSLISGAIAGGISHTITSPLERLKIIQQIQISKSPKYTGVFSSLNTIYTEEGIRGLFKGNGTNVIRVIPNSAIQFMSFDGYKHAISSLDYPNVMVRTMIAGGLTGITSTVICYPLDLTRSILSIQPHSIKRGIVDILSSIIRKDGIRGLYRGLLSTSVGIFPYVSINMTVFDILKTRTNTTSTQAHIMHFIVGACSGFCAAVSTYPLDVVRRRLQLNGIHHANLPQYSGISQCIQKMFQDEGICGFYKGLVPCLFKVVPSMAVTFMLNEALRTYFKHEPVKSFSRA